MKKYLEIYPKTRKNHGILSDQKSGNPAKKEENQGIRSMSGLQASYWNAFLFLTMKWR